MKQIDITVEDEIMEKELKALYQEMEILRTLEHKRIVKYYRMENDQASVSLIMKYMKGESLLKQVKAKKGLQENDARKYCKQRYWKGWHIYMKRE